MHALVVDCPIALDRKEKEGQLDTLKSEMNKDVEMNIPEAKHDEADVQQDCVEDMKDVAVQWGGALLILNDFVDHGSPESTGPTTPFKRIWCSFEHMKVLELKMMIDVYAVSGACVEMLTDGLQNLPIRPRHAIKKDMRVVPHPWRH